MCFGGMTQTGQQNQQQLLNQNTNQNTSQTQSTAPPSWLTAAAQQNLGFAQNLQNAGFTPYSGQMVAGFSPQQQQSFGLGTDLANSVNGGPIGTMVGNAASAGPSSVNANTIASQMSPYMNQYVMQALAPQLQQQDVQFAGQNKAVDAAATGAGAYGDTGWGQLRGTTTQAQDAARQGLIGNAYNAAFNTAIGAGAQDVSNKLAASTTNANLNETALQRQLAGASELYGLGSNATNLTNQLGAQQTAQQQAALNAQYNQWLMAQQYPFQTSQNLNAAIAGAVPGAPMSSTSTGTATGTTLGTGQSQGQTYAPNNAGYGILGSLIGAAPGLIGSNPGTNAAGAATGGSGFLGWLSDPKAKDNIEKVGNLFDGLPVYSFSYKGDPLERRTIGLMSTDVKKVAPEAVDESGPLDRVDYSLATRRSAGIARGIADQLMAA